jgi:tryptophan synthase beta chain
VSYDQKPYRRALMETYGATLHRQPVNETNSGRAILAQGPQPPRLAGHRHQRGGGGRGQNDDTKYALGSVLNHVLMHQTIIGQEAMLQLEMAGDDPDVIVGCTGGGSNFAGIAFPFIGQQLRGGPQAAHRGGGTRRLPQPDARQVRLRLRRHRAPDAADQDAHAGQHLHAAGLPRRRPALPRHGAAGVAPEGAGPDRGHGLPPERLLRGRRAVRARRGHRARAGGQPRGQGRHRRGAALQGRRQGRDHPVQPVRPRPLRHEAYSNYFAGKLVDQPYDEAELAMALAGLPFSLAVLVAGAGVTTLAGSLRLGLVVGVGIVAPTIIADYHFSGRRWTLTGLTAAHRIVHIVLMSCVLGAFNQYT